MSAEQERDARLFLEELYGPEPDGLIAITVAPAWNKPRCCKAPAGAIYYAVGRRDVYFRLGLVARQPHGRGVEADTIAIPGVWVEIDLNGSPDGRGSVITDAAPTIEAAMELACSVLEPTVTVRSGYGLHAYHLFAELWRLRTDQDRARAKALVQGWQARLRREAKERGIERLDSTHDLARVFRVPGSFNGKAGQPAPVQLLQTAGPRYTLEQIAAEVVEIEDEPVVDTSGAVPDVAGILERHDDLAKIVAREGTEPGDGSASEWDFMLCRRAAEHGYDDRILAALIRHARRTHGETKGERNDYVRRTVAAAREKVGLLEDQDPARAGDRDRGRPSLDLDGRSDASVARWPAPMRKEAFYGPLGDAVVALEDRVETCREALLFEVIAFHGSAIGRTAYVQVQRTRHYANEYGALVGRSSRSRKGSVRDVAADLIGFADPGWKENAIIGGATSGEGIVNAVRDPVIRKRRASQKDRDDPAMSDAIDDEGYIVEEVDAGVSDKRKVFDEGELSVVYKVASREGNILSEKLRDFFDKGSGQITNKNSPARATNAHVTINGHITAEELRARLTELDAASGWANRFLYCATRRVRRLPFGSIDDDQIKALTPPIKQGLDWARKHKPRLTWGESAVGRWRQFYNAISDDTEGLTGRLTDRAEAHVLRIAISYAVADRSRTIERPHLEAALAVWDYCAASVAWIWGAALGSAKAERILAALKQRDERSRTELYDLFSRHVDEREMTEARDLLRTRGYVDMTIVPTGGRPVEIWKLVPPGEQSDQSDQSSGGSDLSSLISLSSRVPAPDENAPHDLGDPADRESARPEPRDEQLDPDTKAAIERLAADYFADRERARECP